MSVSGPTGQTSVKPVEITYFSDILCIWAYASQVRVDAVREKFADLVLIEQRFCSVFGDTERKIAANWKDKGGYQGFNLHLRQVAERFPHIEVDPDIWLKARPSTSASAHLFMKAVQLSDQKMGAAGGRSAPGLFDKVIWSLRCAFFRDGRDIANRTTQCEIAAAAGADINAIENHIRDGSAYARLAADYQDADRMRIEGSPSFVMNEGRQKLYGNVGFRLIDANIRELLRAPHADEASWC